MPQVVDKLNIHLNRLNMRLKSTSSQLGLYTLKALTGLLLGFVVALVGQILIGYGSFSFTFVSIVIMSIFLRISREWQLAGVLIFDLICFSAALLFKVYVQYSLTT